MAITPLIHRRSPARTEGHDNVLESLAQSNTFESVESQCCEKHAEIPAAVIGRLYDIICISRYLMRCLSLPHWVLHQSRLLAHRTLQARLSRNNKKAKQGPMNLQGNLYYFRRPDPPAISIHPLLLEAW